MGFWNKLFGNNSEQKVGGMEDFMTLIRVYFQAAMAADLGITNLAALPDLRVFKTTLKVPTVNNKLGVGERSGSGCTDLPAAVPGLYSGHHDAYRQPDEV